MAVSAADLEEAALAGQFGVISALNQATGSMVAFERSQRDSYSITPCLRDVALICNREKTFPGEWISGEGSDIAPAFFRYALPLIRGEVPRIMENGLPKYLYRK